MQDNHEANPDAPQPTSTRRQFLASAGRKALYVAPIVATLAASRGALAASAGASCASAGEACDGDGDCCGGLTCQSLTCQP